MEFVKYSVGEGNLTEKQVYDIIQNKKNIMDVIDPYGTKRMGYGASISKVSYTKDRNNPIEIIVSMGDSAD